MITTFGQIKRGEYFFFNGKKWKRENHACFAIPYGDIGKGHVGIHFDTTTIVEPITTFVANTDGDSDRQMRMKQDGLDAYGADAPCKHCLKDKDEHIGTTLECPRK